MQLAEDDKIRYKNEMKSWEDHMVEIGREDVIRERSLPSKKRAAAAKRPAVKKAAKKVKAKAAKKTTSAAKSKATKAASKSGSKKTA